MRPDYVQEFLNGCVIGALYGLGVAWFMGSLAPLMPAWGGWCLGSALYNGFKAWRSA